MILSVLLGQLIGGFIVVLAIKLKFDKPTKKETPLVDFHNFMLDFLDNTPGSKI